MAPLQRQNDPAASQAHQLLCQVPETCKGNEIQVEGKAGLWRRHLAVDQSTQKCSTSRCRVPGAGPRRHLIEARLECNKFIEEFGFGIPSDLLGNRNYDLGALISRCRKPSRLGAGRTPGGAPHPSPAGTAEARRQEPGRAAAKAWPRPPQSPGVSGQPMCQHTCAHTHSHAPAPRVPLQGSRTSASGTSGFHQQPQPFHRTHVTLPLAENARWVMILPSSARTV